VEADRRALEAAKSESARAQAALEEQQEKERFAREYADQLAKQKAAAEAAATAASSPQGSGGAEEDGDEEFVEETMLLGGKQVPLSAVSQEDIDQMTAEEFDVRTHRQAHREQLAERRRGAHGAVWLCFFSAELLAPGRRARRSVLSVAACAFLSHSRLSAKQIVQTHWNCVTRESLKALLSCLHRSSLNGGCWCCCSCGRLWWCCFDLLPLLDLSPRVVRQRHLEQRRLAEAQNARRARRIGHQLLVQHDAVHAVRCTGGGRDCTEHTKQNKMQAYVRFKRPATRERALCREVL